MRKFVVEEDDLKGLILADRKLTALEHGGVNNWEWYDEAMDNYDDDNVSFDSYQEIA